MGTLALLSEALCEQQECNETKKAELPAAFQKPDPLITASGLCVCEFITFHACVCSQICFALDLASGICLKFSAMDKMTETELHLSQMPPDKRRLSLC